MKVLFACIPADGHFNPLTGLAVYMQSRGHDVRWYTGPSYAQKLERLGIAHAPFVRALDINGENLSEHYPEYKALGNGPKAIAFALEKVFFVNLEAHLHDILELRADFPFDAILFDAAFYAGRLVAEKTGAAAYPIWPAPTPAPVSRTAPPPFFGLKPMGGPLGRMRDAMVMKLLAGSTKKGMALWNQLRAKEGLPPWDGSMFDLHLDSSAAMFMVGCPSMDFPRDDWPPRFEFVGALVAHRSSGAQPLPKAIAEKLDQFKGRVVIVSQGTIDNRDPQKLFVPTLQALANSEYLVIATTGGRHTHDLRARFTQDNVIVEDYLDYGSLMPRADLFITNGGYGSVMQALINKVPLLLAGRLEGKNDVNARMDYRGLGIDLRSERPSAKRIAASVKKILSSPTYRDTVARLHDVLTSYDPFAIIERRVLDDYHRTSGQENSQSALSAI